MAVETPADDSDRLQGGGPTVRRIIFGVQLRRLREAAGISRSQAGYSIRGSESKISRLELGRVGFKIRDVEDLLTMYGVENPGERAAILDLAKASNERGWWHRYNDLMPSWFQDYVGLEESTSRIQTYELQFVPGLMQIEAYVEAVLSHGRPEHGGEGLKRLVALRMERQKLLNQPHAPKLWAVIDESVLHRPLGGRAVLRKQIDHLLEITKLPHISLQIVPYSLSGYAAEGSFTMLRFALNELPNIVYIEHLGGAVYLDRLEEIELYSRVFDRLMVDAETPDRSRQMLSKIREEI